MSRPTPTDRHRTAAPVDPGAAPTATDSDGAAAGGRRVHPAARVLVRGPWETGAAILIGVGVVMLMQPFFLWAYTYSFLVILVGTVGFIIVSHFPEGD